MKRTKIISTLLSLSMLAALAVPGILSQPVVEAADRQEQENEGMEVNKYATANDDGTYTITLEAYATGEKITTEVTKEIPTDIVLVLDQSGSMVQNKISTYDFRAYEDQSSYWGTIYKTRNEDYYEMRHNEGNKNLWYLLEDGGYASVSVVMTEGNMNYKPIGNERNNYYWNNKNNLYAYVNGELHKVVLTTENEGEWWDETTYYVYSLENGTEITRSENWRGYPDFKNIDGDVLYLASVDENTNQYTYMYTDDSDKLHIIGTSIGAEKRPEFGPFYERYESGSITRLAALKSAVENFADSVSTKAAGADGKYGTEDDVDHRIAVVGFAYGNEGYGSDSRYTNTELFIGSEQYKYGNINQNQYQNAFQKMNTIQGRQNVDSSIDALDANGPTYVNFGLEIANSILKANPVSPGDKRNRVVIVFTDGEPGWSSYENDVAQEAIDQAEIVRNGGANVYSVGIFDGADATSAGNRFGTNTEKANWFMQNMSDNKGVPQDPSYYLSAADADTLNDIFQQISDQIQEGGASTTLDENAVIKDVIAPSFMLPDETDVSDIELKTYAYGVNNTWTENTGNSMGAHADIIGNTISVTGFDFADNWCGTEEVNGKTTYRGNKLVISFDVVPKDDFLGGNNVPTNTSAGVYEDFAAEEPVFTFPVPEANVPIKDVTVEEEDKNVYLLGDLTAEQIKSGATAKCGKVELVLDRENYGLEPWQYEFVNIGVTYKDADDNAVTNLTDLEDDTTYTVEVTITPKGAGEDAVGTPNSSIGETASDKVSINVFKPELTFTDGEVWYGGEAPDDDYSGYLEATQWKHQNILSSSVQMTGAEPKLKLTYTPESGKITNGKIDTKDDISVDVAVKIGGTDVTEDTVFVHTPCDGKECTAPENGAFWLHVNTCQLTITKKGGAKDEPYVFTVLKDGAIYTSLTIKGNGEVTIKELPVGRYSIQEDEKWSWRYNGTEGNAVTLSSSGPSGSIACTNKKDEDPWLNDYSPVIKNIYGEEQTVVNE